MPSEIHHFRLLLTHIPRISSNQMGQLKNVHSQMYALIHGMFVRVAPNSMVQKMVGVYSLTPFPKKVNTRSLFMFVEAMYATLPRQILWSNKTLHAAPFAACNPNPQIALGFPCLFQRANEQVYSNCRRINSGVRNGSKCLSLSLRMYLSASDCDQAER